jgi:hypothetical protein
MAFSMYRARSPIDLDGAGMTSRSSFALAAIGGTLIPFVVAVTAASAILASGILDPAPLVEPVSEIKTPNPEKAPWYFLGFQELLVSYHPFLAGTMMPMAILLGCATIAWWIIAIVALPPVQGTPGSARRLRWVVLVSVIFGLALASPWLYVIYRETFDPWRMPGPFDDWRTFQR